MVDSGFTPIELLNEIIPGLYLGSIGATQNSQDLAALGITHLLCVGVNPL